MLVPTPARAVWMQVGNARPSQAVSEETGVHLEVAVRPLLHIDLKSDC